MNADVIFVNKNWNRWNRLIRRRRPSMLSMIHHTPAELCIPPIRIPHFMPVRDCPPHLHASNHITIPMEIVEYDFPSPTIAESCVMCDIPFRDGVETDDGDTCTSCVAIYRNRIRHGVPMPTCIICQSECYYIHRQCGRSLCVSCKYGLQACPFCKIPIWNCTDEYKQNWFDSINRKNRSHV